MERCPECRKVLSSHLAVCEHCGHDLVAIPRDLHRPVDGSWAQPGTLAHKFYLALVYSVIVLALVGLGTLVYFIVF